MIWCGWVFWHINHSGLLNAKTSLYIYIEYMIGKCITLITFLNEPELVFSLLTVEWFQVFRSNKNNSM